VASLLALQVVFAIIVWSVAARAVWRSRAYGGPALRSLRWSAFDGSGSLSPRFGRELARRFGGTPLESMVLALRGDSPMATDSEPVGELSSVGESSDAERVGLLDDVVDSLRPPIRLLRGLATAGTTAGLLAAIATLRRALGVGTQGALEAAAARGLDCAVTGFLTALPLWTAIALCRQNFRRSYDEIDLALRSTSRRRKGSDGPKPTPTGMDDGPATK